MHSISNASSKRKLMLGISALALTAASSAASAQEAADVTDEVVVTGIRASLERSLDIKRNAKGVVDAISAEDMGKFPDSNLAESLQRVTGVSIDRENGEGARVTVRGFGADFNLVTLNGRQMPTSTLGGGNDAPSTRSFDFGNLASEAVAGVDIYKTGRASVPSGGIGSLINIRTTRPLEAPGFNATVMHKYVDDQSANSGNAGAEYSALVSNTFMDDRLGVALSMITQEREHSVNHARVQWLDWRNGGQASGNAIFDAADNTVNAPTADQVYSFPQNTGYVIKDFTQDRTNYQLTAQYDVNDSIRATVDYTFAERDMKMDGNDVSVWFNNANINSAWGSESPVPSILYYEEDFGSTPSDLAMGVFSTNNVNETESTGFNVEYDVNDRLSLALDFHDSSAESRPDGPYGSENVIGSAVFNIAKQKVDYTQEIPVISITPASGVTDIFDVNERNATGSVLHNAYFRNDITQARVDGTYQLDNEFLDSLDFGFSTSESEIRSAYGFIQADNWEGVNVDGANIPNSTWGPTLDLPPLFSGLGGSSQILGKYQQINFNTLLTYTQNIPADEAKTTSWGSPLAPICGDEPDCEADYTTDRRIKEETTSWYVQGTKDFDIDGMAATIVAGVRFEETDVTSTALVPQPTHVAWTGANELSVVYGDNNDFSTITGSYDHILPSVDFDIDLEDNLKLRASLSRTITRPSYADMQGGQTLSGVWRPTIASGEPFNGTGSSGNPALAPYESDNIDVSLEYYYGDVSYASVGYFEKDVSNWIGSSFTDVTTGQGQGVLADPILDPSNGPRTQACIDNGTAVDNNALLTCLQDTATGEIKGEAGDAPLVVRMTQPTASDRVQTLEGLEFAWQHELTKVPFTDIDLEGFGVILNYTIVDGDADYDNSLPSSAGNQFALIGLSDSANFVGYYEKDGLSARVAYNWRDQFLNFAGASSGYAAEYEQIDMNISYEVPNTNITLTYDGINLTEENTRTFERNNPNYVTFAMPGSARHYLGARYSF